jgi:hypothetical protein
MLATIRSSLLFSRLLSRNVKVKVHNLNTFHTV